MRVLNPQIWIRVPAPALAMSKTCEFCTKTATHWMDLHIPFYPKGTEWENVYGMDFIVLYGLVHVCEDHFWDVLIAQELPWVAPPLLPGD